MTKSANTRRSASDWWGIDVSDQDRMAVEQQGVVADRPNEHLGVSDGGIIQMRKMMREALAAVAAGKDPLCVIRDPRSRMSISSAMPAASRKSATMSAMSRAMANARRPR